MTAQVVRFPNTRLENADIIRNQEARAKIDRRIDYVQAELLGIMRIGVPDLVPRHVIDTKFEELDRLYAWKEMT